MKNGVGLGLTVKLGFGLSNILSRLELFQKDLDEALMFHNLYESFPLPNTKDYTENNRKRLKELVIKKSEDVNEKIKFINHGIKFTEKKERIKLISRVALLKLINSRFLAIYKDEESGKLGNENLGIKITQHLTRVRESVADFIKSIDNDRENLKLNGVSEKYWEHLNEAIDIYSIGYHRTSVFVAGRTIEGAVDDILRAMIKSGKIKNINLRSTKFDSKIGMLKANGLIEEKLFHDLNSIKFDRNDTGHPVAVTMSKDENEIFIKRSIIIIKKLQLVKS